MDRVILARALRIDNKFYRVQLSIYLNIFKCIMNTDTVSLIKQYKSIPEVLLVYPSPTGQYQMRPYFNCSIPCTYIDFPSIYASSIVFMVALVFRSVVLVMVNFKIFKMIFYYNLLSIHQLERSS